MITPNKNVENQDLRKAVIANAVGTNAYVISIGDAIQPGATGHNKFATGAASSNPILGIVVAIEYNGKPSEKNSVTGVNSTTAVGGPSLVGNDNETTKAWRVVYIPAYVPMDYIIDLSATAGTTTDSGGFGYLNLIGVSTVAGAAGTLDEGSIILFGGTAGQFVTFSVTDFSTTKITGRINKQL
jgi:hypothetical protein